MFKRSIILTENDDYSDKVSTALLVKESCKRFDTYVFNPDEMIYGTAGIFANAHKAHFKKGKFVIEKATKRIDLNDNNLVHIRLDPPFNQRYLTTLHLLSKLGKKSLVINNPTGIIHLPEKIIPNELLKFMPETIFSRDKAEIERFFKKHKQVVLKPIYDFGGNNVYKITTKAELNKRVDEYLKKYTEAAIVQEFLPGISKGDKRIGFINGEVFCHYARVPKKGNFLAAIEHGYGIAQKSNLTKTEKEICKILKPLLRKSGIFLCGIDVIDNHLTEVNVTNPAMFTAVNSLYSIRSEINYWDKLEQRLKKH